MKISMMMPGILGLARCQAHMRTCSLLPVSHTAWGRAGPWRNTRSVARSSPAWRTSYRLCPKSVSGMSGTCHTGGSGSYAEHRGRWVPPFPQDYTRERESLVMPGTHCRVYQIVEAITAIVLSKTLCYRLLLSPIHAVRRSRKVVNPAHPLSAHPGRRHGIAIEETGRRSGLGWGHILWQGEGVGWGGGSRAMHPG